MSLSELIIDIPAEYEMNVFGQFDTYIKKIERTFHVTLISRDGATKIVGDTIAAQKAQRVLTQLVEAAKLREYDYGTECRLCNFTRI